MKRLTIISICFLFLFVCTVPVQAHSGRTDASGGHRDNKNVSGLGYYHYHHGYGPHLHPGGVCPYSSSSSSKPASTPSAASSSTKTVAKPQPNIKVILNDQELQFDTAPTMESGRVLVPLRVIMESLGASVDWDEATNTITATKPGIQVRLIVGGMAYKNGQQVYLDVPAKIINGRTMVPLRFISESLGCQVNWDDSNNIARISN